MLNPKWKAMLAGVAAAWIFTMPAVGAASVEVDGVPLGDDEGWGRAGTSYMTLRALRDRGDYVLSWDGRRAVLSGEGMELVAVPGECYIEVNGRALYVAEGVGVLEGRTYLPLRIIADATGGELNWDGTRSVAGLELEGAFAPSADYDEQGLYWLSRIISAESRGEPIVGQIAVGNVVLNRVAHVNYPDTIRDVVFDANHGVQFEPVSNGTVYNEPTEKSVLAAKMVLEGADVVEDCIYFYAPALSPGTWINRNAEYYITIGCHRFYR